MYLVLEDEYNYVDFYGGILVYTVSQKGKGVIYRMIDEFNNDVPYDFKNIQFKRYKITRCPNCTTLIGKYTAREDSKYEIDKENPKWTYTFTHIDNDGNILDHSIVGATTPNTTGYYVGVSHADVLGVNYRIGDKIAGVYPSAGEGTRIRIPCLGDEFYLGNENFSGEVAVGKFAVPEAGKTTMKISDSKAAGFCIAIEDERDLIMGQVNEGSKLYRCRVISL